MELTLPDKTVKSFIDIKNGNYNWQDEMLVSFFLFSADKTNDLIHVVFDNLKHDTQLPRKSVET